jgi:hypothetical protein
VSTPALQPTANVYYPKTECRLSRDIFSFEKLAGTKVSNLDNSYPIVTQNIGNLYYTGYDTSSRKFGNFAYVDTKGSWWITHDYAESPELTTEGGLIDFEIGSAVTAGKGHWVNTPDRTKVSSLWRGSIEVGRYEYPLRSGDGLSIKRVVINRVWSGGAFVYSTTVTTPYVWLAFFPDTGTGITTNLALSKIGSSSYILAVANKYPVGDGWNPHIHIEFWKLSGMTEKKLTPFWSLPIDDTDYKQDGSVDTTQWTEFCYSAPYDGNGLSTSLGMSVTVFNADKNGKAMYFVEQDGFCSDIKSVIPVYNSSQPDYTEGLGSTSFKPTGLVQVGIRRDTLWSGLYLTGTFTRTAEDGIGIQMQTYLRGNSLLTNSDTVSSGVATGLFGWTFGARNSFLATSEGQVVFPHPTDSKWALEFDYEPTWQSDFGETWPTVVDANSGANNAFDALIPYWYAFASGGAVYRANMDASTHHNPPWVAASDILQWSFQEATDTASSVTIVVERSSASKFQSGNTVGLRYWSTGESTGASAGVLVGYFQIEEESFDNSSGLQQPLTIQCLDTSSSIINNWSSPIDMFFDPRFVSPLSEKGNKSLDPIPSLANLLQKTPDRSVGKWDKITGYSHNGINRPAIFFNPITIHSQNAINKHRIKFDTSVDANVGIQAIGSLFSAYKDGTMAGAFLMQTPASGNARAIYAQSDNDRSVSVLDTGAHSTRIATNATNRVTIMGAYLPPLKNDDGTEKSQWEIEDGGRSLVGMNGPQTIAGAASYRTKAEETIFGASADWEYGIHRIAGNGVYLYDANVSITQGAQYDFATKTVGDTVLVWYKPVQYDATTPSPPASNTNNWVLCTYYKASPMHDSWMRPNQNKYTGVALSTDAWFAKNSIWPDAELGRQDIRYNSALGTTDGINGNQSQSPPTRAIERYLLQNLPANNVVGVTGGAGGSVEVTTPSTTLGFPMTLTGFGGIFKMKGLVYTGRWWDCVGNKAVSVEMGIDPTNPMNTFTGDSSMTNWVFSFVPNVLFRAETVAATNLADELGIPYRTLDSTPPSGYMIVGDEIMRWAHAAVDRGIARPGESSTDGDYLIHVPTDICAIGVNSSKVTVTHAGSEKIMIGTWRNGAKAWQGWRTNPLRPIAAELFRTTATGGGTAHNIQIADDIGTSYQNCAMVVLTGTRAGETYWIHNPNGQNLPADGNTGNYDLSGVPGAGSVISIQSPWFRHEALDASQTSFDVGRTGSYNFGPDGLGIPDYHDVLRVGMYIQFNDRVGAGAITNTTTDQYVDLSKEVLRITSVGNTDHEYYGWKATIGVARAQLGTTATTHMRDATIWEIPELGVSGVLGMGKNLHFEVLSPYGINGESSEHHMTNFNVVNSDWTEATVAETVTTVPAEFDFGVMSGRAQLGSTKNPHAIGQFISSYPVKHTGTMAGSGGYPADYDRDGGLNDEFSLDAIKDAVRLYRSATFSGAYKSVRDNLFATTALSGARSVFKEKYAEITNSYVDTLQSLYTTGNWSITLQARKSVNANANFKSAVIRFRASNPYYLTLESWTGGENRAWEGDANVRGLKLKLSYGSEGSNVLEEIVVPFLGMNVNYNLTLPIVVSLSGDVLSVDALDENLWSFDFSQYTDGATSLYRTTIPGLVEIKTLDTQIACYWFSSELGDEVESTVVDRGAPASAAFSFLLNGRWVKTIISREGFLQHGRFFTRRSPFDFYNTGASTLRSRYTLTTQEVQNPQIAAGHVESSGAEFAEIIDDSWIRSNGYIFKEAQNRLLLTASDSRLESRLRIRAEKEANEHIMIVGHPTPAVQPEDAVSWNSNGAQDYVVDSHTIEVALASASSKLSCRKYYDIQ